jgi:hypothetical protein
MAESSELIGRIRDLDPKSGEFAEVMQVMAEKVADLRHDEGRVTPGIFFPMLKLVGVHPAIEALVTGPNEELLLKRRATTENVTTAEQESWGGRLHIPGAIFNAANSFKENLHSLVDREIIGLEGSDHAFGVNGATLTATHCGTYFADVPERHIVGVTSLIRVPILDLSTLRPGFEVVGLHNLDQVILQHQPVVLKVIDRHLTFNHRAVIFDTRNL